MVTSYQEQNLNILIVEDDEDTAEVVCTLLQDAGFRATAVDRGEMALDKITAQNPDLVLLDLNLPDISGIEVLRHVRSHSFLPMIVLSGFGKDKDRVVALEAGADDYMAKPFSPEELIARVKALLRRVEWTPKPETHLRVRDLELDMPRRQATIHGAKLHLTPIEYGILVMLMRQAGQVVSHEDLLSSVWNDEYKDDFSVLRVNISRLRQKLEDNPRRPTYIVTAPGQGYWMPTSR
ncbi:MAG: response regulator transcription factor [Chloroflexota bacterium]